MNEDTKFTDLSEMLHDHESAVANLMALFERFHAAREATYKRSFAKRGEVGVWMNLARKYDRFEALAPQVLLGEGNGVTLIDTLVDTAMYSLKWLDVISKIRPNDFEEWLRTVYCKDTGMGFDDVVMAYPFLASLGATTKLDDLLSDSEPYDEYVSFVLREDPDTVHTGYRSAVTGAIKKRNGNVYWPAAVQSVEVE